MTVTLTPVNDVIELTPPEVVPLVITVPAQATPLELLTPGSLISVVDVPDSPVGLLVPVPGASGADGADGTNGTDGLGAIFTYTMPVAQTTAVIDHTLGRDPLVVQVLGEDGIEVDEYGVVFTVPDAQVRVSFDISIAATIRMT